MMDEIDETVIEELHKIREKVEYTYKVSLYDRRRFKPIPDAKKMFVLLVNEVYPLDVPFVEYRARKNIPNKLLNQENLCKYMQIKNRSSISNYLITGKNLLQCDKNFLSIFNTLKVPTLKYLMYLLNKKIIYLNALEKEIKSTSLEIDKLVKQKNEFYANENQ